MYISRITTMYISSIISIFKFFHCGFIVKFFIYVNLDLNVFVDKRITSSEARRSRAKI